MPGPQGCVGGCLRVVTRGDGYWRKVSRGVGDAAPYGLPGMGGSGNLPLIRPCGATFPRGGRQGLQGRDSSLPGKGGGGRSRRGGAPRPTDGDMETLWGLREQSFPGRRAVGAGHARPGSLRGRRFAGLFVGRGLDPFAGRRGRRPLRFAGNGRRREPAPHPALRGHLPPRGKARAVWRQREPPPTPAAGPRCGAGGSGCSTSGLTKPALYRRNLGRCRGGSRR